MTGKCYPHRSRPCVETPYLLFDRRLTTNTRIVIVITVDYLIFQLLNTHDDFVWLEVVSGEDDMLMMHCGHAKYCELFGACAN